MVHEPDQVTQCKMLSKVHLWENSHRHISINQASNWTGQQDNVEHTESEGSFLAPSWSTTLDIWSRIIILFLEGSSFGPALLFVPMRHSRTTSLIVLIMIFVQGTTCMLESIFWRKGKCFHKIPAFKKQGNMEYKIILSEWYRSWQRLNLFENIWLKNVAGKEDRRGDWCWIIRLG